MRTNDCEPTLYPTITHLVPPCVVVAIGYMNGTAGRSDGDEYSAHMFVASYPCPGFVTSYVESKQKFNKNKITTSFFRLFHGTQSTMNYWKLNNNNPLAVGVGVSQSVPMDCWIVVGWF